MPAAIAKTTPSLLLIGAGGHARACIDIVEQASTFQILGLVDNAEDLQGTDVLGYPILGRDSDLPSLLTRCPRALITVGQIGLPNIRKRLFTYLKALGSELPTISSPYAILSPHASVSAGVLLGHQAIVHAAATIGENTIINSGALIEHDARIGAHCHIATGALVNGAVRIEEDCFIGSGAILREGITIGAGSFISAGSLVTRNCPPSTLIKRSS